MSVPEGSTSELPINLALPPSAEVTVRVNGYEGTDLNVEPTELTFTTKDWNSEKTLQLRAEKDADFTDDQIDLNLTASGGGYDEVTCTVRATVADNDLLSLSIEDVRDPSQIESDPEITLLGNYPNPFSSSTSILIASPVSTRFQIELFDASGREIMKLPFPELQSGILTIPLNLQRMPQGTYFYRILLDEPAEYRTLTGNMVLVR